MSGSPVNSYREMAVRGASPIGLVVMLHDAAVLSLREARAAIGAGDIEGRTRALNRVLGVLGELQGSLNLEQGGEPAWRLDRFYSLMRAKILEAAMKSSVETVDLVGEQFALQRDAWRKVEEVEGRSGQATVAVLPVPAAAPAAAHDGGGPAPRPVSQPGAARLARARWSA